jgi:hypothetical protein
MLSEKSNRFNPSKVKCQVYSSLTGVDTVGTTVIHQSLSRPAIRVTGRLDSSLPVCHKLPKRNSYNEHYFTAVLLLYEIGKETGIKLRQRAKRQKEICNRTLYH